MDVYLKNTYLPICMLAGTYVPYALYLMLFVVIDLYYIYVCMFAIVYSLTIWSFVFGINLSKLSNL